MSSEGLAGKTIVVTGGAGGIGSACIERFVCDGARVAVIDPNPAALDAIESRFPERSSLFPIRSQLESFDSCVRALAPLAGPIYALVHLAGAYEGDGLEAEDREVWDRMIAVNLTTAFDMVAACAKHFDPATVSRIVLASSVAYRRGSVDHLGYSAAKGGLAALVRALSRQLAPNVLVNAVAPGVISTTMTRPLIAARADRLMAEIPLQRWGEASETAGVIAFLCSSDSSYITGQVINVDGGMVNS